VIRIRVRIKVDGIVQRIGRAKSEIPVAAEEALRELAGEALALVKTASERTRRELVEKHLSRQFAAIFAPVQLQHKRRELWPDLAAIYQARIVRGQRTYDGRKRLYVDEKKENELFETLAAAAMEKRKAEIYDVRFMRAYGGRYRLEIIRRGRGKIPAVVIAYARQHVQYAADETMRAVLLKAGLR
jgi:hypothetical protein